MRAVALGSDTARFSSSRSRIRVCRENKKKKRDPPARFRRISFPRSRVNPLSISENCTRKSVGAVTVVVTHRLILSSRSRKITSSFSQVLINLCQREKKKDREKYTTEEILPNGMLSGIWEVLAARSHLYATPPFAPRDIGSFSLLPHRRRWMGTPSAPVVRS